MVFSFFVSMLIFSSHFISCSQSVIEVPIIIVKLSISLFDSISLCFMYFEVLSLGAHAFRIAMSYLGIDPFIII